MQFHARRIDHGMSTPSFNSGLQRVISHDDQKLAGSRSWLEVKTQVGWYEANSKHTVRSAAKQRVGHLRVGENSGFEISFVSTSDSADAEVILAGFL